MPNIKARITNKHDTEANWALAENFKPLAGEVIVYDVDSNYAYPRFKVGDGKTLVSALPFSTDVLASYVTETELASALNETTSAINKNIATIDDEVATHIAAINNPHSVTKSQIGLGNVDNTSDANKPISTAAQEVFDSIENNLNNLPDIYEKKENLSATVDNLKLNEQFTLPEGVYDKIVNNKNFTLVCNFQNGECVKFSAWSKANFLGTDLLTSLSVLSLANMSSDVKDDSIGGHLISISKQSNSELAYIKQYLLVFDGGTFSDLTAGEAIADIDGNNIPDTYAKKTEIPDISNFAEKNGTYPEMAVGNATNSENANSANSAANAEDSAKLGGVVAENYAQIDGQYVDMTVGSALNSTDAQNVVASIQGQPLTNIFESNGTTVKNATNATNADTADSATSAQDSAKLGGVVAENYAQIDGTYSGMTVGAATKDGNGNIIASTYARATGSYPMLTAGVATLATKATQDGNGNNIFDTYAQKSELSYMHYLTVDLSDKFHFVCSIRNKSSAQITSKSELLQAFLNIGQNKGISATGFLLDSMQGGMIFEVAAMSPTILSIRTISTPEAGTVNTYVFTTASSSIGVQDSVPTL